MGFINTQAVADARNARWGKDGALYNSKGILIATVESFSSKLNVTTSDYKPLGILNGQKVVTGTAVTLTFSQYVVEDDALFQELVKFMETGVVPDWNFTGALKGDNNSEERVVYRNCIPDGDIDLQNITPGEPVKRSWNFHCNSTPNLQNKLTR